MSTMDINEIQQYLPHRYPFLLVDRVLECVPGERIVAIKNVTFNEPFFPGHFPKLPIMPGVLIIEAMAQAAAILAFKTANRLPSDDSLVYFLGIDEARFKSPVTPGDQLKFTARIERTIKNVWKFAAEATVDGKVAAEAKMMCTMREG
ncbi:MAG TPA: 3-hydroxyacyl-ACP dehydratase FabZ [Burkholderiales bacterium]|nr:3-hydroxyacyl-ACP dehydratase FabZ [Burkholderiales bacterium]